MTKEELKNKCKEIAQEITIKNVTDGKSKYYCSGYYKGCLAGLEYNNKQIAELEKENAELKETLKTYNGCGDWDNDFHTCRVYLQHEELQDYIEQLTKAKEILAKLLEEEKNNMYWEMNGSDKSSYYEVRKEAEQFLSGVEK